MPSYRAPSKTCRFLLQDVFQHRALQQSAGLRGRHARTCWTPSSARRPSSARTCCSRSTAAGDIEGCRRDPDGSRARAEAASRRATTPSPQGGWIGLAADPEYGGQGLPYALAAVVNEFIVVGQHGARPCIPGLTMGAIAALHRHGSPEQKAAYLPKMIAGEWTGTMNLTEPHCGTDLGLIRTKAVPSADGSYAISGTKIFISAGEHDLADNIVHLVLARIEGAPEGVKGISLFLVPKRAGRTPTARSASATASPAARSSTRWASTATPPACMNYDGATGWLVGEPHRGLAAMFVMMNEARLGVGIQGLAQSEVAYQNAVAYAKDRLQGRALTGAEGAGQAGRPDHRPPRRAAHAADDPRLQRGRPRARALDRAAERRRPPLPGRGGAAGGRRPCSA